MAFVKPFPFQQSPNLYHSSHQSYLSIRAYQCIRHHMLMCPGSGRLWGHIPAQGLREQTCGRTGMMKGCTGGMSTRQEESGFRRDLSHLGG